MVSPSLIALRTLVTSSMNLNKSRTWVVDANELEHRRSLLFYENECGCLRNNKTRISQIIAD